MLFLTVAYDWMYFQHNLKHRTIKGEEIMKFAFYFLENITDASYSYHHFQNLFQEVTFLFMFRRLYFVDIFLLFR